MFFLRPMYRTIVVTHHLYYDNWLAQLFSIQMIIGYVRLYWPRPPGIHMPQLPEACRAHRVCVFYYSFVIYDPLPPNSQLPQNKSLNTIISSLTIHPQSASLNIYCTKETLALYVYLYVYGNYNTNCEHYLIITFFNTGTQLVMRYVCIHSKLGAIIIYG